MEGYYYTIAKRQDGRNDRTVTRDFVLDIWMMKLLRYAFLSHFPVAALLLLAPGIVIASNRNNLEHVTSLRNDYFALRHGQSKANVKKIIASNPNVACMEYGLSELGNSQARSAGETVVQTYHACKGKYKGIAILSSDLLRAKETAEHVAEAARDYNIPIYNNKVVLETRLRERGFGKYDLGSDTHYHDVWKDDAIDPTHEIMDVESVMSVTDRASACIVEWDEILQDFLVVCVAHGDVLQILQTAFNKMDGSKHRTLDHLETAILRPLVLSQTNS